MFHTIVAPWYTALLEGQHVEQSMDLEPGFRALPPAAQLAVATAAVERILPLYVIAEGPDDVPDAPSASTILRDATTISWLVVEGRKPTKQDISRAMNEVTALIPRHHDDGIAHRVCVAATCMLEAASHNPDAALAALDAALRAVAAYAGDDAGDDERGWQRWATRQAARAPTRTTFTSPDAPRTAWRSLNERALPLFGGQG